MCVSLIIVLYMSYIVIYISIHIYIYIYIYHVFCMSPLRGSVTPAADVEADGFIMDSFGIHNGNIMDS